MFMEVSHPIVPIDLFKHARIDSFTVSYKVMLISVGGVVFNRMIKTATFSYLL